MKANLENLTGRYNVSGRVFSNKEKPFKLILSDRGFSDGQKAKLYLIAKPVKGSFFEDRTRYKYVSSLYEISGERQVYRLECAGKNYLLSFDESTAEIVTASVHVKAFSTCSASANAYV